MTEEEDEGRGRASESLGGEAWSCSCCSRAVCACCLSNGSSSVLEAACSNAKARYTGAGVAKELMIVMKYDIPSV